jgi:putative ABC transport system ATP-binding protein
MTAQNLIQFEKITKVYQAVDIETYAINEVSLEIKAGEYVAICGPSGGGKSSILSVMGLLDDFTNGNYFFKGQDVSRMSRSEKSKIRNHEIGFVFQSFNLIDNLSVFDNVALPLRYRQNLSSAELNDRVREALNSVSMDHRIKHFPGQLSGGQQQRVAVARAFIIQPSIILADEPTGNLDSKSAEIVMELLRKQCESGVTICMVTHDPRFTQDATKMIEVLDGTVKAVHKNIIEESQVALV